VAAANRLRDQQEAAAVLDANAAAWSEQIDDGEVDLGAAVDHLLRSGDRGTADRLLAEYSRREKEQADADMADYLRYEASPSQIQDFVEQKHAAERQQRQAETQAEEDRINGELGVRMQALAVAAAKGYSDPAAVIDRVAAKLQSGELPTTDAEMTALVHEAGREYSIASDVLASIDAQVESKLRAHKSMRGMHQDAMTSSDAKRRDDFYRQQRRAELIAERQLTAQDVAPAENAEQAKQRQLERIAAREKQGESFESNVAGIEARARAAEELGRPPAPTSATWVGRSRRRTAPRDASAERLRRLGVLELRRSLRRRR
jgi:hypothetical protein